MIFLSHSKTGGGLSTLTPATSNTAIQLVFFICFSRCELLRPES